MKRLTFEEVMDRYDELVNSEYEFPSFSSYYVTDVWMAKLSHPILFF